MNGIKSSLWVMNGSLRGIKEKEFDNKSIFNFTIWNILCAKYISEYQKLKFDEDYIYNPKRLNIENLELLYSRVYSSDSMTDKIILELSNQQIFSSNNKDLVSNCIINFLDENKESKYLNPEIIKVFYQIAEKIKYIDWYNYPYFMYEIKNGMSEWFNSHNKSLIYLDEYVADFIDLNKEKAISKTSNTEFVKHNHKRELAQQEYDRINKPIHEARMRFLKYEYERDIASAKFWSNY